jgi:hypothetical protein
VPTCDHPHKKKKKKQNKTEKKKKKKNFVRSSATTQHNMTSAIQMGRRHVIHVALFVQQPSSLRTGVG